MHIALRLLRDGAHTTITTRFPRDAVRRFSSLPDAPEWLHRLRVVGIDLRDPAQVVALADSVAAQGPLDILINNAAQTVRRSPGSYSLLADAETPAASGRSAARDGDLRSHERPAPAGARGIRRQPPHPVGRVPRGHDRRNGRTGPDRRRPGRARDGSRLVVPGAPRRRQRDRRRRSRARHQPCEQLDAEHRGCRPARDARGAALQHDGAVPADQPTARIDGRDGAPPLVRRERVRDGGRLRPTLQGPGPSAHQHGESGSQHAHPHERRARCSRPTAS